MRDSKSMCPSPSKKKCRDTPAQKIARLFERLKKGDADSSVMNTCGNQAVGRKIRVLRIVGMGMVVGLCGWLARYGIDQVPYIGHAPGLLLGTLLLVWLAPKTKTNDDRSQ
ncbi:hypothetical protein AB4Z35_04515 [Pseudomonas sp. KB_15]|uniref:hypothetical protein n=1 Tax=Pseudomonas sp. KB_15 TaxID=3233035 RepID=UPI003F9BD436